MKTTTVILAAALAFAPAAPAAGHCSQESTAQYVGATAIQKHKNKHHGKNKRHKRKKYVVTDFDVFYGGKKLDGASAMSFKVLGDGYAMDDFDVYYKGKNIKEATAMSFKVLQYGYAKDDFNAYYKGKKIAGASAMSFQVLEDGYAKDAFDTYYKGRKCDR